MTTLELLAPMLMAIGAAAIVLALAAAVSFWKQEPARRIATWIAPGIAFATGSLVVGGLPSIPPADAVDWIFYSVCLTAIAGCCTSGLPGWGRWLGRVVAIAALVYLIARPLIGRIWEGNEVYFWLGGFGFIWLLVWAALAQAHRAPRAWPPLLLLLIATVGLSAVLMIAGTASYSQYVLSLAGAIAGAGLASLPFVRRFGVDPRPAAAMLAIPWIGFLLAGYLYVEAPLAAVILTAAAPLSLFFPILPKLKKITALRLLLIQLAWTILLVATAIFTAYSQAPKFDY